MVQSAEYKDAHLFIAAYEQAFNSAFEIFNEGEWESNFLFC